MASGKFWSVVAGVFVVFGVGLVKGEYDFSEVDRVLENGCSEQIFPGAVGLIGDSKGNILHVKAAGHMTYGIPPPATPKTNPEVILSTKYDLASLSKVTAATGAAATFYERGELSVDAFVSDILGSDFSREGKGEIRVRNLLLHNAGFPPDPTPDFWNVSFGCPATKEYHPPLTLDCGDRILEGVFNQSLMYPTGNEYVYSDLSMITMHFVVGFMSRKLNYTTVDDFIPACKAAVATSGEGVSLTCHYEAYVRKHVFGRLNMTDSGFRPDESQWPNIAPTWNDQSYRHLVIQGTVSDGNSYANGGISGHAGVFSTVADLSKLALAWLSPPTEQEIRSNNIQRPYLLNKTTVDFFIAQKNASQSSRAFGWDTNAPQNDYHGCGALSEKTFTHLGFTGTEICIDPINEIYTILLDNRVYPDIYGRFEEIRTARQSFNNATLAAITT